MNDEVENLDHDIEFLRSQQKRLEQIIDCIERIGSFRKLLQQRKFEDERLQSAIEEIGEHRAFNLADMEKRTILAALKAFGGDRLKAADALGIGKTTTYRKLKEYGIIADRSIRKS